MTVTALVDREAASARVAYAVNRSVGNAVVRNRVRRRLRAVVQSAALEPGAYLVSASAAAGTLPFDELAAHVQRAATA